MLGELNKIKREIEYAEALERIVWLHGDLDLERLTHKQLLQRLKALRNKAEKASQQYRGF